MPINVIITNTLNAKVVKVRFRSAGNGDTLFGFIWFLAPADTWSINVSSDGVDGKSFATATDASCTLLANPNASFFTMRSPASLDEAKNADWTREGLVEIIMMAAVSERSIALFQAVASSHPAVRRCDDTSAGAAALHALVQDPASEAVARAMQVSEVRNLFLRTPDIAVVTDWAVSQPLRRNAVAVDASAAVPTLVFNRAPAGPSGYHCGSPDDGARASPLRDGVSCNRWGSRPGTQWGGQSTAFFGRHDSGERRRFVRQRRG